MIGRIWNHEQKSIVNSTGHLDLRFFSSNQCAANGEDCKDRDYRARQVTPAQALRQGLRDFGYTEGQNLLIDYRYVEGKHDRIPELIAEVLNLKIDIIVQWAPWLLSRPKSSRISRLFSAPAVIRLQLE